MPSKLTKNRRKEVNAALLNDKQQMFVKEYLADSSYDATAAARKAGYKQPQQAAGRLMRQKRIIALIGNEHNKRSKKLGLDADGVWEYLSGVLQLNPFDYFLLSENGYWVIENPKKLPASVAQFVESFELEETVIDETKYIRYKVKLISKATALALAVKVQMVEKHEHKVEHSMSWDKFLGQGDNNDPNVIEARLIEEEKG